MANKQDQMKELTERLEEGVKSVFESDKYEEYLRVMSKFYNYSYRNTLLIALQKPDATMVAGYEAWKKKFGRQVNKGEKGIKILAPAPYRTKKEMEVIDKVTQTPVRREDGSIVTEEVEVTIPAFRVANVFDVSQTSGRPLPSLFENIEGDVKGFERFYKAVESVSPAPIGFEEMDDKDGYYHQTEKRIALREGMSERQTAAAAIHEISHATLHALDMAHLKESLKARGKDQKTMEIEAESIAYVVCQHYGIETGENSFGYIAMWSKDKSLPELQASLKIIRDTASDIIGRIDEKLAEMEREEQQELAEEQEMEHGLLYGEENRFGIYQIAEGTRADDFKFMRKDFFDRQGIPVLREDYQLVYSGILGEEDSLDTIFEKFNLDRPKDFKGHSLSVSDIVLLHKDGKNTAHFVDSFGFQEIPEFLNLSEERVYRLLEGDGAEKYFMIQRSEEGLDYTFYDAEYRMLDGGVVTNADQPIENAVRSILGDAGLHLTGRVEDVDVFLERAEKAEMARITKKASTDRRLTVSKEAQEVHETKSDNNPLQTGSDEKSESRKTKVQKEHVRTLPCIEFYVAECEDVHDMGEYRTYPDIESAVKKYQEILDDPRRKYKGNGMGIIYHGAEGDVYNNSTCCLVSERDVCGNALDSSGLAEKAEVREALHLLRDSFPEFRYKMPKYEKEANTAMLTVEELAVRLDRLVHDFEPYNYQERLRGQENLIQDITLSLYTGGVKHYTSLLDEVIRAGGRLATEADELREHLHGFSPIVPTNKEPIVRVERCDSDIFPHERYMSIGTFDQAVAKLDQVLNSKNAGKDEDKFDTSIIQFTIFYPEDGKIGTLKDSIGVGYGNGGFFSTLRMQDEEKLTSENWLSYKRGQGQAEYDAFVIGLTNIIEIVLPHLQTFCMKPDSVQECAESAKTIAKEHDWETTAESENISNKGSKEGRKNGLLVRTDNKRSIHERLASNKAKIEKQVVKGNLVRGVERTC